jgi:hypothetical protein
VAGSVGAPAQFDVSAALKHAVEDGLGEIGVVQDTAHAASGLLVVKIMGR